MRQNSRSIVIYVLFGILIVVFILSFGPQSGRGPGRGGGCSVDNTYVVKVGDVAVQEQSWRFGMVGLNFAGASSMRTRMARGRETVMDGLIERELLAQQAAKMGFAISDKEVESRIAKGEIYLLGRPWPGQLIYFDDGVFDFDMLERYAKGLGLPSVGAFEGEQKREMLAQKLRELVRASVKVSPDEVLAEYQRENTHVSIDYVKFQPRLYKKALNMSDADLDAWIAANDKAIKDKYDADKNLYTSGGKWVQVRLVFEKRDNPLPAPDAPAKAAPDAAGGDAGAEAAPAPKTPDLPDPGLARAQAARSRIKGGEAFDKVAREVSQDERSAPRGGLQEWRRLTALGWGAEVTKAVEAMKPGDVSDVIETTRGFVVVKVEGVADGGPSYDQLKKDLAWDLARDAKAKELAKADADAAFAKAKAGQPLDQIFERGSPDNDDVDDSGDGAQVAPEPAGKPDDKKPGDKAAAKPGDKAAPAAPAPLVAPPKLRASGPLDKSGTVVSGAGGDRYVGRSAELAKAVFTEVAEGQLGPQVYEVEDGFVIFRVSEKKEPDMDAFEKDKADLAARMAEQKSEGVIERWTNRHCLEARAAGTVSVNMQYVEYGDVDEKTGQKKKSAYQPCTGGGDIMGGLPPGMMLQ